MNMKDMEEERVRGPQGLHVQAARSARAFGKYPSAEQIFLEHHLCAKNYSRYWDITVNQANKGCVLMELIFSLEDGPGSPENHHITPPISKELAYLVVGAGESAVCRAGLQA